MQKSVRSYANRLFIPASIAISVLVSGCGTFGDKNTDEAKRYEASQAIDSGNYDKAIAMLEKDCAGFSYEYCQLNLGAAYLGKAGFDVIGLGGDMLKIDANATATDSEKEIQMTTLLFDKLFDPTLSTGITEYKKLLDNNGTECNGVDYQTLTSVQKQACIAINPILLQELTSDSNTKTTNTVDLQTVLEFKSIVDAAIPGLSTQEFVNVVSGGTAITGTAKDVNNNGIPDQLEATDCTIKYINGNDLSACTTAGVAFYSRDESNVAIGSNEFNVTRGYITSSTSSPDKDFARLWMSETLSKTTVTLLDTNVTSDGTTACDNSADAASVGSCYPAPKLSSTGEVTTFADTAVNIINNPAVISSMAELSDTSDGTTPQQKVDNLKTDICGSPTCTATQEDVLNYMNMTK